jgi:hypothetical protein
MATFDMMRVIKVRSVENASYKPSYNRMRFELMADNMSTDLSKSYLAFQLFLTNPNGDKLTNVDIANLTANHVNVSFGRNGESYPSASLIKVARLYSKKNQNSPLEEINYSNILTAILHQLKHDFETLASSSLLTDASATFTTNSSLATAISSNYDTPIEVHIMLSDIFGCCKSTNFWLSDHPLMIELELEDTKPLFQQTVSVENVPALPRSFGNQVGLLPNPSTSPYQTYAVGQNEFGLTNSLLPSPGSITKPKSVLFDSSYFTDFFASNIAVNTIELIPQWSTSNIASLGIDADSVIQMNFKITPVNGIPKMWQRLCVVESTTSYSNVGPVLASIVLDEWFIKPTYTGVLTGATVSLDSFELLPEVLYLQDLTTVQYLSLINENKLTSLDDADIELLQDSGLLSNVAVNLSPSPTNNLFTFSARLKNVSNTPVPLHPLEDSSYVYVLPDEFENPDFPTARGLFSNQSKKLPVQSGQCRIVSTLYNGADDTDITFQTLGLENNNSLQFNLLVPAPISNFPTPVFGGNTGASKFDVFITNFKEPVAPYVNTDYSYQIDKAELVLVQKTKDPKMPPSPIYSTYKLEVATIENQNLDTYNRQFIITEPNTYNLWLCMPQYTASSDGRFPQSLISHARGVNRFRWSVNNIDDTNRDITIKTNKSSYPSSLYLDKLMGTFRNSTERLHSLSGINSVARSVDAPVCLPLRIYTANDEENSYLNPQTFTAQIAMYGDTTHDMNIVEGPIFLFKEMIKALPQ